MEVSLQAVHRYVGFTHFIDMECVAPIEEWLKGRFEVFCTHSVEDSKSGPHVQWYGETRIPWSKVDTNVHGVRGLLGKYIPDKMPVKKAKRWSKQLAKKSRERNCEYVSKGGVQVFMSDGDPEDYVGRWKERGRKRTETFNELLLRLWREGGEPRQHNEIFMMLVRSRAIPWNNFAPVMLYRASDWLLSQCNEDESVSRFERYYEEQSRRHFGN